MHIIGIIVALVIAFGCVTPGLLLALLATSHH